MNYVIRIFNSQNPCWITNCSEGDPPRTLVFNSAQRFASRNDAEDRILEVKKTHPLKTMNYGIIPVGNL